MGLATPDRWNPLPPSPRVKETTVELTHTTCAEAPTAGPLLEAPAGVEEAPVGATEAPPSPTGRGSRDSPI
jgi:hypothetical protein